MSDFEHNLEKAAEYLGRFRGKVTGHFINGVSIVPAGADTFCNLSPIDNQSLGVAFAGGGGNFAATGVEGNGRFGAWPPDEEPV